jgi:hypothetical protein
MEAPNYYAMLPANVRYDKELTSSEKVFYCELTALANRYGFCFASNNYFAKLYNVSKITISRWVSKLEQKDYIKTQMIRDGKQILQRRIYIINSEKGINIDVKNPINIDVKNPINIDVKDNNINNNNTRYNKVLTENTLTKSKVLNLFNSSYPKTINRATFEPILIQFDGDLNELVNGLQRYTKYCKAVKPKLQHIISGTNFIKSKRYMDGFEYTKDPEEERIDHAPKLKIIRADR